MKEGSCWVVKCIVIDIMGGTDINVAISETISLAAREKSPVSFNFNGVDVTVKADSKSDLIRRDWQRALAGFTKKKVGPYPNATLTELELAKDALAEARQRVEQLEQDERTRSPGE